MAMTMNEVKKLLDDCDVEHAPGPEDTLLLLVKASSGPIPVVLARDQKEGKWIQFRTMGMLKAPDLKYRRVLLKALLHINYKVTLIKFAFDPKDGEVVGYIDIMLGDGTLTKTQFQRCINTLRFVAARTRDRAKKIMQTGEDPGDEGAGGDVSGQLFQDLMDAMRRTTQTPEKKGGEARAPAGGGGGGKKGQSSGFDRLVDDILDEDDK